MVDLTERKRESRRDDVADTESWSSRKSQRNKGEKDKRT